MGNFLKLIRSTLEILVVKRHQYGISAPVSQTSTVASRKVGFFPRLLQQLQYDFNSPKLYIKQQLKEKKI